MYVFGEKGLIFWSMSDEEEAFSSLRKQACEYLHDPDGKGPSPMFSRDLFTFQDGGHNAAKVFLLII